MIISRTPFRISFFGGGTDYPAWYRNQKTVPTWNYAAVHAYGVPRLITDPAYNIRLGRAYLAGLIERYGGSYVLAIAAYNAGPGAVRGWFRKTGDPRNGDVDMVDWIELIPYPETRNYVQRVLENLQVYRRRLDGTRIAFSLNQDLNR